MSETESFRSEKSGVASAAMDFLVGSVTSEGGIQGTMTLGTVETLLVPHSSFGKLLFSSKDHTTAAGTSLARWSFDGSSIGIVERATSRNFFLGQPIGLQETTSASKTISMGSPFLAVAGLAVNIAIGTVASIDGVKSLGAVVALEALAMPRTAFGEDFFSSEHHASTTGASLAWRGLDTSGVDDGNFWRYAADGEGIALQGTTTLAVAVTFWTESLSITDFTINILIRTFSYINGIQSFIAIATFETSFVERTSPCKHLFSSIYVSTAFWTSFAFRCFSNCLW